MTLDSDTETNEQHPLLDKTIGSRSNGLQVEYQKARKNQRPSSICNEDRFESNSSQKPLFQRILSSQYSVSNANSPFDPNLNNSSFNLSWDVASASEDEQTRRQSILVSTRAFRLIGVRLRRFEWMQQYVDTSKIKSKKLNHYYEKQNALIERFSQIDNFLDAGKIHINMLSNYEDGHLRIPERIDEEMQPLNMDSENPTFDTFNSKTSRFNENPGNIEIDGAHFLGYNHEEDNKEVVMAILVNFFINFVLLVGKIIVTILTSSISIIASLVDSALDFLSTFIIYIANKLSTTRNWRTEHSYPIGRSRLEPLGILIFSVIIILSFFQVGQQAFMRMVFNLGDRVPVEVGWSAIMIMIITIVSKIACWIWCSNSKSSSVQALAQDAMTDIIFNIVSLIMPTAGHFLNIWWLDPLGALLLSGYVIVSWSVTAFEHIDNLTGAVASDIDYKVVLYLAYRFAESIKQITALKVYHVGDNLNVEIDIVFAYEEFNLTIKDCHDIAEALQYSIESLPKVERAFVHIDYMQGNYKGHLK